MNKDYSKLFRALPSVDALLQGLARDPGLNRAEADPGAGPRLFNFSGLELPRSAVKDLTNEFLDLLRLRIRQGLVRSEAELDAARLLPELKAYAQNRGRPHFRRVINATGVVIHTNLGRSLLAAEAARAAAEAALYYSNLEFDLDTGERGSRYSHVERLLTELTGAEAALVVNNNAAAVLLILDTLCKEREVIVSRGQLVEIGGSFRIPEVMAKSGCILREVGCTNRVRLSDYASAINENTAAILKVHTSNYRIVGFHNAVPLPELTALGRERGLPVLEDLGSGNLCDFAAAGIPLLAQDEPTVQKTVADGADVVSFSGDKVLGGPQAGIIVGRAEYVSRIKKNPLNRALRIDKLTLAALEATLRLYRDPELALRRIPTLSAVTARPEELKSRAGRLARRLGRDLGVRAVIATRDGTSLVGGGSFPERHLPATLVSLYCENLSAQALRAALLATDPPLIARVEDDRLCLDVRTIQDAEFPLVSAALAQALAANAGK